MEEMEEIEKLEKMNDTMPTDSPEVRTSYNVGSLSMEQKIFACRQVLQPDPINKSSFERRYRPNLESLMSSCLVWGDEVAALRRFQSNARVYEMVEFMINGATDSVLVINFQTQKILEFSRYVDAEVSLVDIMQNEQLGIK